MAKEMKFEEALEKLEKIVETMEGGGLSLDEAIKKFEEGMALRKYCEDKLKSTERRVEMILKKEFKDPRDPGGGTPETGPFDSAAPEDTPAPKKRRKDTGSGEAPSESGDTPSGSGDTPSGSGEGSLF